MTTVSHIGAVEDMPRDGRESDGSKLKPKTTFLITMQQRSVNDPCVGSSQPSRECGQCVPRGGLYVCIHIYMYVYIYIYPLATQRGGDLPRGGPPQGGLPRWGLYMCIHIYICVYIYTPSGNPRGGVTPGATGVILV